MADHIKTPNLSYLLLDREPIPLTPTALQTADLYIITLFTTSGAPGFAREDIFWHCPELIFSFIIEKIIL